MLHNFKKGHEHWEIMSLVIYLYDLLVLLYLRCFISLGFQF